jgi:microcystin-dependent protein
MWAGGPNTTATYTDSDVPAGWLLCDGSAKNRDGIYNALFLAIGVRYGAGNGSTTFNLPNFTANLPIGSVTANSATSNTRISKTISTGNTSVDHAHNMNASTVTVVADGGSHAHNMNASSITNASENAHNHYTTGNITVAAANHDHVHAYFKANSGQNGYNTGAASAATHTHSTGWNSQNAQGGNITTIATSHSHNNSISIGTPVATTHNHSTSVSIGTPVSTSTALTHLHTTAGQNVVYIIRF